MQERIDDLTARMAALEAIVTQTMIPLLIAAGPNLARELLQTMRREMVGRGSSQADQIAPRASDYIARLIDSIEAGILAKSASHH